MVSNTGIVLANNVSGIIFIVFAYIIFVAALLAPKSVYPTIFEALHLKRRPSLASSPTSVGIYRDHRIAINEKTNDFNDEMIIMPNEDISQIDNSISDSNRDENKLT